MLDADDRIPYVRRRGEYLYNFWQDATNPRGLWRRTTLDEYRTDEPEWETACSTSTRWARPRARTGSGRARRCCGPPTSAAWSSCRAAARTRPWSASSTSTTQAFVEDGFTLPEAKSRVGWIDDDRIYVGTDFGPGSLTASGYPRIAKEWRRGTPLSEADRVFEGKPDDVSAPAPTTIRPRATSATSSAGNLTSTATSRTCARPDGDLVRIDVPDDAETAVHREWLLIRPAHRGRSAARRTRPARCWPRGSTTSWPAGASLTVLFEPDEHTSLATTRGPATT